MSDGQKISPNDTYVLDEEFLDEMDSIDLTGLLDELSEQMAVDADESSTTEDAILPQAPMDDADELITNRGR